MSSPFLCCTEEVEIDSTRRNVHSSRKLLLHTQDLVCRTNRRNSTRRRRRRRFLHSLCIPFPTRHHGLRTPFQFYCCPRFYRHQYTGHLWKRKQERTDIKRGDNQMVRGGDIGHAVRAKGRHVLTARSLIPPLFDTQPAVHTASLNMVATSLVVSRPRSINDHPTSSLLRDCCLGGSRHEYKQSHFEAGLKEGIVDSRNLKRSVNIALCETIRGRI